MSSSDLLINVIILSTKKKVAFNNETSNYPQNL